MRFLRRARGKYDEDQEFTLPTSKDLGDWGQQHREQVARRVADYVLVVCVYGRNRVPIWVSFAELEPQDEEARAWAADQRLKMAGALVA